VDGQSVRPPHNPGKDALLPTIEDLVPKGSFSKGFFQKASDTVGYALGANKYALLPFQPSYGEQRKSEPFKSDLVSYTLGEAGTADLLAACKKEKTTLVAALAAAFLRTAANTKELKERKKDDFSFTSVMECRKFFEPELPADTVGNFVTGIPQTQQAKDGVPFWDLARSVSATIEKDISKSKQFSEIPVLNLLFSQVLKHPGITPQSSMRTALFSMFVDGPPSWTWQSKDTQKLQVASVSGPFPSMHGVGPCFACAETLLNGDDLSVSLVYPQPVFSRSQMQAFGASAMELLNTAAKDC
jgi:hypothetical protein